MPVGEKSVWERIGDCVLCELGKRKRDGEKKQEKKVWGSRKMMLIAWAM